MTLKAVTNLKMPTKKSTRTSPIDSPNPAILSFLPCQVVQDFQDQQEGRNGSSKDQVADSSVEPVDRNIEERHGVRLCVGALTVVEMDGEDQTEDVDQISARKTSLIVQ